MPVSLGVVGGVMCEHCLLWHLPQLLENIVFSLFCVCLCEYENCIPLHVAV